MAQITLKPIKIASNLRQKHLFFDSTREMNPNLKSHTWKNAKKWPQQKLKNTKLPLRTAQRANFALTLETLPDSIEHFCQLCPIDTFYFPFRKKNKNDFWPKKGVFFGFRSKNPAIIFSSWFALYQHSRKLSNEPFCPIRMSKRNPQGSQKIARAELPLNDTLCR